MTTTMESELERYAIATHDVGHDILSCCLEYGGTNDTRPVIVRIADDTNIEPVFRNAMAQLASNNLHRVNYWGMTTVPNKAIARLMESLSECGEKGVAFLIASRPLAPGVVMTTHMCWVNLSGERWAVSDMMHRLMLERHKVRHR